MLKKQKKLNPQLTRDIDEYLRPLLDESDRLGTLSKQEKWALSRLIFNGFNYIMCLLSEYTSKGIIDLGESKKFVDKYIDGEVSYNSIANPKVLRKLREVVSKNGSTDESMEVLFVIDSISEAANVLTLHNIKLLRKILINMLSKNPSRVDENVVSEGVWALLYSVYCFNPYRGIELSTYVAWWIKSLVGSVLDKKRLSKQSQELHWFRRYPAIFGKRAFRKVYKLKHYPSISELEDILGVYIHNLFQIIQEHIETVYMSDPTVIETEVEETVADPSTEDENYLSGDVAKKEYVDITNKILEDIPKEDRAIIEMYYGFTGKKMSTYDIAKKIGKSPTYVQNKINMYLKYFREVLEKRYGFTEEDVPGE